MRSLAKPRAPARFVDTCLIDTLRSLGLRVPYERSGPFWALKDGNCFLRPLKCSATNYSLVCGHVSRGSTAQRSPRQCVKQLKRSLISDPVTANASWLPGTYVVFHRQLLHFWGVEVFSDGEAMCYKSCRRHEGYSVTLNFVVYLIEMMTIY